LGKHQPLKALLLNKTIVKFKKYQKYFIFERIYF